MDHAVTRNFERGLGREAETTPLEVRVSFRFGGIPVFWSLWSRRISRKLFDVPFRVRRRDMRRRQEVLVQRDVIL